MLPIESGLNNNLYTCSGPNISIKFQMCSSGLIESSICGEKHTLLSLNEMVLTVIAWFLSGPKKVTVLVKFLYSLKLVGSVNISLYVYATHIRFGTLSKPKLVFNGKET